MNKFCVMHFYAESAFLFIYEILNFLKKFDNMPSRVLSLPTERYSQDFSHKCQQNYSRVTFKFQKWLEETFNESTGQCFNKILNCCNFLSFK